jgi:CheY-like chemotaxis protein
MERAEIPKPVRVLLVEDSSTVREAVASEFRPDPDFEIVAEAASVSEARRVLATADVVILDLGLPDGSGADLIRELRDANPDARTMWSPGGRLPLCPTGSPALSPTPARSRFRSRTDRR